MRFFARWILREIRNDRAWVFLFVCSLGLGLFGFVSLQSLRDALESGLRQNARDIMAADFAVSSRRRVQARELQAAREALKPARESRVTELFSMAVGSGASRLVHVKAIDAAYPLYGEIELKSGRKIRSGGASPLAEGKNVWVFPETLTQLKLRIGETIRIGDAAFVVQDVILKDSSQSFRVAGFAPKIYVGERYLPETGLMGLGTTFNEIRLFEVPGASDADLARIVRDLEKTFQDPTVQFSTPMETAQDSARGLQSLLDYLGLVSLVGLALGLVGIAYLLQLFLARRLSTFALLRTLGFLATEAELFVIVELAFLGLISALFVLPMAWLMLSPLNALMAEFSPVPLTLKLQPETILVSFLLCTFLPALIAWPLLRPLRALGLRQVLLEREIWKSPFRVRDFWTWAPALLAYFSMAVWVSHSLRNAGIFIASLLGAAILIIGSSGIVLRWLPTLGTRWWARQTRLRLARSPLRFGVVILALSLGTLLLVLLPQLRTSLETELASPTGANLPSFFLFDIQDEQLKPLDEFLKEENLGAELQSPMIKARILSVNGFPFERGGDRGGFQSREEENEARFRNRGVNLTYRARLSESEELTAGEPFSGASGAVAQLSVEERYAERLGFKLGDVLRFDVQGIEIEGRVHNLRAVKWNQFRPNFFISFQPGFLEDAPKTWIANLPPVPADRIEGLQNKLVAKFPNVSVIDVSRVISKIVELSGQMTASLTAMAGLSVLVGLFVLFTVFATEAASRATEWNLYKVLGAPSGEVLRLFLLESALVAGLAALLGGTLGVGITWALMKWMFAMPVHFAVGEILLALFVPFLFSLLLSWNLARRLLGTSASSLLAEGRL